LPAEFQDHLKHEREAHNERLAAVLRIHRDKNNEALDAAGNGFDRYDRARENLDEFMLQYDKLKGEIFRHAPRGNGTESRTCCKSVLNYPVISASYVNLLAETEGFEPSIRLYSV
jgi:hypothetical protein